MLGPVPSIYNRWIVSTWLDPRHKAEDDDGEGGDGETGELRHPPPSSRTSYGMTEEGDPFTLIPPKSNPVIFFPLFPVPQIRGIMFWLST